MAMRNLAVGAVVVLGMGALVSLVWWSKPKPLNYPSSSGIAATSTEQQVYRLDLGTIANREDLKIPVSGLYVSHNEVVVIPLILKNIETKVDTLKPGVIEKIQTKAVCDPKKIANKQSLTSNLQAAVNTGMITPGETGVVSQVRLEIPQSTIPQEGKTFCVGFRSRSAGWLWNMAPITLPDGVRSAKVSVGVNVQKQDIDLVSILFDDTITLSAIALKITP